MERREFLKVSALAGGGLMLTLSGCAGYSKDNEETESSTVSFNAFLKIKPDGAVLFQFSKHEMGQGVSTALAMILAEELCADWEKVQIQFPDLDLAKFENKEHGGHGSGGSTTVLTMTPILRRAGAIAREMLIKAASIEWNVPADECMAYHHAVVHTKTDRRKSFGWLAVAASSQEPPANYTLKERADFTLVGKPVAAKLISKIATGSLQYGIDAKVPGMLYAVIARCPVHGGKLKSFRDESALSVPGVRKVVTTQSVAGYRDISHGYEIRDGVAVVADSIWNAMAGRNALEIEWDEGANGSRGLKDFEELLESVAIGDTKATGFIGDVDAFEKMKNNGPVMSATYTFPYQLHAPMEPLNCIAHFKGKSCEFWIGNQGPENLASEVSRDLGLEPESIRVHLYPSGGGFGRRYKADFGIEAACISREAGNVPIKLLWTREDDHLTNFAHIYQRMDYKAVLDEGGEIIVWYEKDSRSYDFGRKTVPRELSWIGYDIPHVRYDMIDHSRESLLQSVPWRAVTANGFALSECFIDEIALSLNKDPYEFRLSMLKEGRDVDVGHGHPVSNTRIINTLRLAIERSDWSNPVEPDQGRGMAVYPYLHGNGYCAMVAEVTVKGKQVKVDKVVCAVDCGMVVNPSGARNQIEGGVVWGLTAMFYGGIEIENGRVQRSNFHQNKMIRINECPDIEVHFVDGGKSTTTWGIGEIANPVIVPAVLNAIYHATGKRIRKLPVSFDDAG